VAAQALVLALLAASLAPTAQPQEVVAEVRIHGNVATSDEEVRQLAGVEVGSGVGADTVEQIARRLRATNRFRRVEVLKRFASIADPTQIVLIIIVDEGPVKIQQTGDPDHPTRVVRAHGPNLLFLPILTAEDGYGLIYGGQLGLPDPVGKRSRLSFPATWGGEKRVAAELEKEFDDMPLNRVSAGAAISRRTHPFFRQDEDRDRVWVRGERQLAHAVRAGATAGWQHVSFLNADASFVHAGADIVLDTRLDPMLARNAVYARAAWDHFDIRGGSAVDRLQLEGRSYIGLVGQSVLVLRALREDATEPLPPYLQPILGGLANLRGFRAGTAVGDTLVAGSAEVRLPLTSPLSIGKVGVSGFVDTGTVYDKGQRLADQTFKRGIGGSLWFAAAFLRLNIAVAHGIGAGTRVHVGGSLTF
jgi:hypothetical protein